MIDTGANLGFLKGSQSNVNTIINNSTAQQGYFYLTEDTHRLYVGNKDGSLSAVNEGVIFVSNLSDLPNSSTVTVPWSNLQGQMYYVGGSSNILCIASGQQWVQINPDTYLKHSTQAVSLESITSGVKVTTTVSDTKDGTNTVHTASGDFSIVGTNVGVAVNTLTKTITLSAPNGSLYTVSAAAAGNTAADGVTLTLTNVNDNTQSSAVNLKPGDGGVTPTWDSTNNCIVFNGGGFAGNSKAFNITESNGTLTLTVIDGAGQRVSTTITPTITLGGSNPSSPTTTVTGTLSNGTLTYDLPVYTRTDVDNMITNRFQSLDAMYYAGTFGTGGTVGSWRSFITNTALELKPGATLKVLADDRSNPTTEFQNVNGTDWSSRISVSGYDATKGITTGDLIIVHDGPIDTTTGYIDINATTTTNKVLIDIVPSGDDPDIYFTPNFETAKTLQWTQSGVSAPYTYQAIFANGTDISITGTYDNSGTRTNKQTLTINHATITTTPTTGSQVTQSSSNTEPEYTAITGLTINNGHVTGYTTQKLKLWTNSLKRVETVATSTSSRNNSTNVTTSTATVTTGYYDQTNVTPTGRNKNNLELTSSTLQITTPSGNSIGTANGTNDAVNANIAINMIWGTFDPVI